MHCSLLSAMYVVLHCHLCVHYVFVCYLALFPDGPFMVCVIIIVLIWVLTCI